MRKGMLALVVVAATLWSPRVTAQQVATPAQVNLTIDLDPVSEFPPLVIYAKWWAELRTCAELDVPVALPSHLRFFVVLSANGYTLNGGDRRYAATTLPAWGRIYIAATAVTEKKVIQHEFLHYMLFQVAQSPAHDHPLFAKCGVGEE